MKEDILSIINNASLAWTQSEDTSTGRSLTLAEYRFVYALRALSSYVTDPIMFYITYPEVQHWKVLADTDIFGNIEDCASILASDLDVPTSLSSTDMHVCTIYSIYSTQIRDPAFQNDYGRQSLTLCIAGLVLSFYLRSKLHNELSETWKVDVIGVASKVSDIFGSIIEGLLARNKLPRSGSTSIATAYDLIPLMLTQHG